MLRVEYLPAQTTTAGATIAQLRVQCDPYDNTSCISIPFSAPARWFAIGGRVCALRLFDQATKRSMAYVTWDLQTLAAQIWGTNNIVSVFPQETLYATGRSIVLLGCCTLTLDVPHVQVSAVQAIYYSPSSAIAAAPLLLINRSQNDQRAWVSTATAALLFVQLVALCCAFRAALQ